MCGFDAISLGGVQNVSDWPAVSEYSYLGTLHVRNIVKGIRNGMWSAQREQADLRQGILVSCQRLDTQWDWNLRAKAYAARWKALMKSSAGTRILMLLENCPYPNDDRVRREARALTAAGYRVSVISPRFAAQPWHEIVDGVSVYRFPWLIRARGFLGYLWEYGFATSAIFVVSLFVFVREGFDILHGHHPPDTFVFIALFYKLFGKRFVYDHHDLAPELYYARFRGKGNQRVYNALAWLEILSCRFADRVITTNQSYKKIEMERDRVPEERISIVRNGPDLNELHLAEPIPELRQKAPVIIGYVGSMGIQDGVDYMLRALHHLVHDFGKEDWYCVLVGMGTAFPVLQSLTQELDLSDHVHFTRWVEQQSEVARYLSSMDICIAPEPSDPYNDRSTAAKVMEYMALGKPTVAFNLPEHRFTAQQAALYAQSNDEKDLARQIVLLMDSQELRSQLGVIGKERIEKELAWSHQAKHLLGAYAALGTGTPASAIKDQQAVL